MFELNRVIFFEHSNKRVNDYRIRLAERARGFPECPGARLVNRRNSPKVTKLEKCANDCFILHMFLNGERSREINEVFSTNSNVTFSDSILIGHDSQRNITLPDKSATHQTDDLRSPDLKASIVRIQSDIANINARQNRDSEIIQKISADLGEMTVVIGLVHATLKGLLARSPAETHIAKVDKLQTDVTKISSTLGIISKKINNDEVSRVTENIQKAAYENNTSAKLNYADIVSEKAKPTADDVEPCSKPQNKTSNRVIQGPSSSTPTKHVQTTSDEKLKNKNIQMTNSKPSQKSNSENADLTDTRINVNKEKCTLRRDNAPTAHTERPDPSDSKRKYFKAANRESDHAQTDENEIRHEGFVAVKRKKITSYHISNIDRDVSERDIYLYCKDAKLYVSKISVFRGKIGASARINISSNDEDIVENSEFWPEEITCRKWKAKTEWDKELSERRVERRRQYEIRQSRWNQQYNFAADDYNGNYEDYDNDQSDARETDKNDFGHWGTKNY